MKILILLLLVQALTNRSQNEVWPDGTKIDSWFNDTTAVMSADLGPAYRLTDYGIYSDGCLYTEEIQALIDRISTEGGGRLVVPAGTFLTGGLHFRQGVHLEVQAGGVLKGSDNIIDYPIGKTRIEGETCTYFGALINAEGLDGFTILGPGTIDGSGQRFHEAFWLRRTWNPACTNKDEQRPRLVYISGCKNVKIEGIRLQHAPFWTCHIYNSERVRIQNCSMYSLAKPDHKKGPSTDAIDLDVVQDVLIRRCYMEVNDDAVAIKGGKGPWADDPTKSEGNGPNRNILIEDCEYGFCHGCLTLGSESVYDHNILMRRIRVHEARRLLWLKMRPDTPQRYEYITLEDISGEVDYVLYIHPWTQFYDLKDRTDLPKSYADHVTLRRCRMKANIREIDIVEANEQYELSNMQY